MATSKMKTRSKNSTKTVAEAAAAAASTAPKVPLNPDSSNPPKLFILPKSASLAARIVMIAEPAGSSDSRYLCCPEEGFYEFKKFTAPKTTPRSWLLIPSDVGAVPSKKQKSSGSTEDFNGDYTGSQGYVTKAAEMFIATPIDPLFFILPVLAPKAPMEDSEPAKRLFLACDDYYDNMVSKSPQLRSLLRLSTIRNLLEARMAAVCDTVDAGDETMYRLNKSKLLDELLEKAEKMAEIGLPASMEEKFVRRALDVPMLSMKLGKTFSQGEVESSSVATPATDSVDSQTSVSSTNTLTTSDSSTSTAATSFSTADDEAAPIKPGVHAPILAPDGVVHLLRLRTALYFITTSYLPPHLRKAIAALLSSVSSPIDFSTLDAHLVHLATLRQEAFASRSLGDFSRKRCLDEDAEAGETRADKKRKKEEEEKRKKAAESRGVRDLKKVNVTGMKKMSHFFKKT